MKTSLLSLSLWLVFVLPAAHGTDQWLARRSAPIEGRSVHTAVWTGKEVVVFGGEAFGVCFGDGARFDPDKNQWAAMSTKNAPQKRSRHVAVWTGCEMVVWGGFNGQHLNDGGRYDPMTDTWKPVSTSGAPSGRLVPGAVWTGTEVLIWGSAGPGDGHNDGALYNPVTDTWRPMSQENAPSPRLDSKWVWTGKEFLVWGGVYRGNDLADGFAYDPRSDSWRSIRTPEGFSGHNYIHSVWTGTEWVIWGGGSCTEFGRFVNTGARYNPATDTWTMMTTDGAPKNRGHNSIVWTGKEVIVFGGATDGHINLNSGGRYDPVKDTWEPLTNKGVPMPTRHEVALWTGASMIIYGGYTTYDHGSACFSWSPEDFADDKSRSWWTEYFGADYRHKPGARPDSDSNNNGRSNLEEFLAGSSPLDFDEGFSTSLSLQPVLRWNSVPGRKYRIVKKSAPGAREWEVVMESFEATEAVSVYVDFGENSGKASYAVQPIK